MANRKYIECIVPGIDKHHFGSDFVLVATDGHTRIIRVYEGHSDYQKLLELALILDPNFKPKEES